MNEEWRPVVGFEGFYEVSNLGKIRTVERTFFSSDKKKRLIKVHNMMPAVDKDGYFRVHLRKNKKSYNRFVHRLVAQAFVPNPFDFPQINHKDENKQNNLASNLEWCDTVYNNNYGKRTELARKKLENRKDLSKRVSQFYENGEYIATYDSLKEIGRIFGFDPSFIGKACSGRYKSAYGFIWRFLE